MKYIKYQITSEVAYQWVDYCKKELYKLNQLHKSGTTLNKFYQFPGGVYAELIVTDIQDTIRLFGVDSGFICHPRDDVYPGGISTENNPIASVYTYPLVDNDKGSFILISDGSNPPIWEMSRDVENYGNIDWQGTEGTILSWRGPASRMFTMDNTINYAGFTKYDFTYNDIDYYTSYTNFLYQSGEILKTFPTTYKVLGAAINNGLVIVIVLNSTGTTEVWVEDNIIYSGDISSNNTPWFFDSQGLNAVNGDLKLTIQNDLESAAINSYPVIAGTQTNNYSNLEGGEWGIQQVGSWTMYRDFVGDVEQSIQLNLTRNESTRGQGSHTVQYENLDIKILSSEDAMVISGTETPSNGSVYTVSNAHLPVQWSITKGTINSSGVVSNMSSQCGTGTVTATDVCGRTATKKVRFVNGAWYLVDSSCLSLSCNSCHSGNGNPVSVTGYYTQGSCNFGCGSSWCYTVWDNFYKVSVALSNQSCCDQAPLEVDTMGITISCGTCTCPNPTFPANIYTFCGASHWGRYEWRCADGTP